MGKPERGVGCWPKGRTQEGFSLIELLVVCALIVIMLSLAVPNLRTGVFSDPLRSAARNIIGLVAGVREQALRDHQPYFLKFNRLENRVWYEKDVPQEQTGRRTTGQFSLAEGLRIQGIWIDDRDMSSLDEVAVWITKEGFLYKTRIRIEEGAGKGLFLQFQPFTHSVQIAELVTEFDR